MAKLGNTKTKQLNNNTVLLHVMVMIPLVFLLIFNFYPMISGFQIAFKEYQPGLGVAGSKWVGFAQFREMFMTQDALRAFRNTILIAVAKIIANLIVPVCVALLLNEIRVKWFKRTVQTITYLPYFLSWVILASILTNILSPDGGLVNRLIEALGGQPVYFLGDNSVFRKTLVVTDVWKNFGYNTIVYMAALTGIDPTLYEAAQMDGAGRLKQTWHITLGISMFIVLMMILSVGNVLNADLIRYSICTMFRFMKAEISLTPWFIVWVCSSTGTHFPRRWGCLNRWFP